MNFLTTLVQWVGGGVDVEMRTYCVTMLFVDIYIDYYVHILVPFV